MNQTIVVVIAEGFEEIEAVTPIDVWRRIGFNVIVAGLTSETVVGAHDIIFIADTILEEATCDGAAAIFLPGGMPGSVNLKKSSLLQSILKSMAAADGVLVTAICAAPIVLHNAGVIDNKRVTCYPGFDKELTTSNYTGEFIEIDGDIITGKGPGAAAGFAFAVARALGAGEKVSQFEKGMLFK